MHSMAYQLHWRVHSPSASSKGTRAGPPHAVQSPATSPRHPFWLSHGHSKHRNSCTPASNALAESLASVLAQANRTTPPAWLFRGHCSWRSSPRVTGSTAVARSAAGTSHGPTVATTGVPEHWLDREGGLQRYDPGGGDVSAAAIGATRFAHNTVDTTTAHTAVAAALPVL